MKHQMQSTKVFPFLTFCLWQVLTYPIVVNILKPAHWDEQSKFDNGKDKAVFRNYVDACERVKNFYKEQHGVYFFECYKILF
jgi:hypothetical protein